MMFQPLDGTKIHANASRHSALSYEHAGKIEAQLNRAFTNNQAERDGRMMKLRQKIVNVHVPTPFVADRPSRPPVIRRDRHIDARQMGGEAHRDWRGACRREPVRPRRPFCARSDQPG
jgi:hypothetical protein